MQLAISSSPHVHSPKKTSNIMLDVVIALLPATVAGIIFFGKNAAILVAVGILAALLSEYIIQKVLNRPVTVGDYSAVVTGLLVALNMPPTATWWMVALGSAFAIIVVKQFFGGLGHNFINPALTARALLLACWPVRMTTTAFTAPITSGAVDAVSSATPMALIKSGALDRLPSLMDVFLGNIGGCIGETSALAILIGLAYLLLRQIISWRIPVTYAGTVFLIAFAAGSFDLTYATYHVLAGGMLLGAVFMATDYTTSPVTPMGQIIMGVGCGLITMLIRLTGGYPEGVSYSILLMNIITPLIDRYTVPHKFGRVVSK